MRWGRVMAAVACGAIAGAFAPSAIAAPPNDNIANATVIGSLPFAKTVDLRSATVEPGDWPECTGWPGHTVWYRYTSPSTQYVRVAYTVREFIGSAPQISAGYGSLGSLNYLDETPCDYFSTLALNLNAGETYWFQYSSQTGRVIDVSFDRIEPATNDLVANAAALPQAPTQAFVNPSTATASGDDPPGCRPSDEPNVWYSYTASKSGPLFATAYEEGYTGTIKVAAYTGTPGAFTPVKCAGTVQLVTKAGTKYWFSLQNIGTERYWSLKLERKLPPGYLLLKATPGKIRAGKSVRLDVTLKGFASVSRRVVILATPKKGVEKQVAAGNVNRARKLVLFLKPKKQTVYRAMWTGGSDYTRSYSQKRTVKVIPKPKFPPIVPRGTV